MPKSRRDKRVSLTQTKKKGLESKQSLIEEVRNCLDLYERVFIFSVSNMRNSKLKEVRNTWKHSRFFYGKNKVMALAFGKTPETEVRTGLYKLAAKLQNEVGLLFTNKTKDEVIQWFKEYSEHDHARAGNIATSTVELAEGPLTQFSHAIEPHLRKLGLPVALKKGIVTMLEEHTVCKDGDVLTPEQCKILKLLNIVMAQFTINMQYMWDKGTGEFEAFEVSPPEQIFNKVRVTSDDQEYDFVDQNMNVVESETKAETKDDLGSETETMVTGKENVPDAENLFASDMVKTPRRSSRIKNKK
uniref:Ribosome assembly factor mrt4 n=1 Tax=Phallusia mammillata TaxID=59560 RepID=A0A6F9DM06_9ASCI|nr:mRNA turnover protein 4 homolog [Phallusia mammillata]